MHGEQDVGTVSAIALALLSLVGVAMREIISLLRRGDEPTIGELARRIDRIDADYDEIRRTLQDVRDAVRDATNRLGGDA